MNSLKKSFFLGFFLVLNIIWAQNIQNTKGFTSSKYKFSIAESKEFHYQSDENKGRYKFNFADSPFDVDMFVYPADRDVKLFREQMLEKFKAQYKSDFHDSVLEMGLQTLQSILDSDGEIAVFVKYLQTNDYTYIFLTYHPLIMAKIGKPDTETPSKQISSYQQLKATDALELISKINIDN